MLHEIDKDFLRGLIVRIDKISPTIFSSICKDEYFTLLWHVPLLLVLLRRTLDLDVFNDKIINMVKNVVVFI